MCIIFLPYRLGISIPPLATLSWATQISNNPRVIKLKSALVQIMLITQVPTQVTNELGNVFTRAEAITHFV